MPPLDWLKSFRTRLRPTPVNRRARRAARLALESLEAREVPALTLTIAPQSVSEAAGASAATGTVTRDGDTSQALTLTLTSSDTTEATVPATVTIGANQSQATFPITAVDDSLVDGTQTVTISATGQTTQGAAFGLDTTFGSGGLTTTSLRTNVQPSFAAIARQADGKILAASEYGGDSWQLIRLNADGSADTSFGSGGVAVTSLAATNRSYPVPHKIVIQSDGKILVGGMYGGWTQTGLTLGILARYNADGSPDATFGSGGVADLSPLANDWVEDIAVRPDGRILLGLGENGVVLGRAAQLNADGTFDTTFGSSGTGVSLPVGYSVTRLLLLPSGQFLAAGTVQQVQAGVYSSAVAVARISADGRATDATFGTNGTGQLNFGTDGVSLAGLALDSQGRIVCGGSTKTHVGSSLLATDFAAGRLTANGTPDTTFAGDGTGAIDVSGQGDVATSMVIQPDDKIVLGGYSDLSTGRDTALARFNADGTPDTTIDGDGGYHQSLVNTFTTDMIFGLALQPDSRLLALTGWATDVRVARFNMGVQTVNVAASNTLNVLDNDAVNHAPTANNQSASTNEDTALSGTLSASDPDGNALTYAKASDPAHGTVTVNANGTFTYTPAANYNGPDSFTFQATDGLLNSNVATVSVTVNAVNDAPVATPDAYTINEDTLLSVQKPGLLVNDTDVDGNALTAVLVTGPANGTLTLNSDGSFSYRPKGNFNGTDSFTYKANDGTADSAVTTVTITVNAVNDAPVAADQSVATNEDTAVSGSVAASDVDGDALTFSVVTGPAHGTLSLGAGGAFTYTPTANYNGPDSFTVKANDGTVDSNIATVSITIRPVNDAPTADAKSVATDEDTAVSVTPTGSDVDGDALTFAVVTSPAHGTVKVNADGSFTYTPAANFNGSDSFTYKANDGALDSGVATVTINVRPVNDAPVAAGQSVTTNEDTPLAGSLSASDVDGNTLTYAVVAGPSHGTLSLGTGGAFTYTLAANYNGPDSFTFKVNDGTVDSNIATVSISVKAVNDAPVADAKSVSTDEDTAVTVTPTGSDVDGDKLTFTVVAAPAHGTVTVNADGSFTYTPAANYNGSDSFTYKANDGVADSSPATVSIAVRPVNDAPVANGASLATDEDLVLNGTAVASDVDGDKLTYLLVSGPAHGTLQLNAGGTFAYTPAANYNGSDSFTFKANDGTADSNVATVSISVRAVNDAPTLTGATFTLPENSPNGTAVGTVAGSDVDGDALTYSIVGGNTSGAFAVNPTTGQIAVANVAALDFERTLTFTLTVQVKDAGGLTGQAQVTVNLTDVPEEASMAIDILPGDDGNSVNIKSHGKIEVAILSSADFDARTVDVSSLRFGRTGQEDSLSRNPHGPRYRLADVNGDGRLDLVVTFETDETGFRVGDTTGILTGQTIDGTSLRAEDAVSIKSPGR